ncbi:hypothetical protein LY78DRAFT_654617 [Colletotrichum sublineola]|nr:hypothetical protein LY78DRAFT_654617 [Colletotrichum sublineola]
MPSPAFSFSGALALPSCAPPKETNAPGFPMPPRPCSANDNPCSASFGSFHQLYTPPVQSSRAATG